MKPHSKLEAERDDLQESLPTCDAVIPWFCIFRHGTEKLLAEDKKEEDINDMFWKKMANYGHPMIAWAIEEGWTHDRDSQVLTDCSEVLPLHYAGLPTDA